MGRIGNQSRLEEIKGALNYVEDYDYEDMGITYCGCFRGLYSPHRYESCQDEQETMKHHRNLLTKKLKKVLSAILKWPKGKRFSLRRLRICSGLNEKRKIQFQYDPKSYALNFDDGAEKEGESVNLDFSARYACPIGGMNKVYLGLGEQGNVNILDW
ncbi:uncharacterized protein LOC113866222 [Abrus precatorius]|uniref:Uncharacterized protein LOC113866222 n=1 Tax=Abrus precatorius TaxID=3816 RepID=A0A8B8LKW6_ABRPR|nr:uncharacterized protein LOC113866222 [Abrus precatorius]